MYLMPNFSHLRKHHVPTFSAKLQRLFAEKDMIAFWDLILDFIFPFSPQTFALDLNLSWADKLFVDALYK